MEVLRTEELTREYGFGDNKVVALNHVSFSVEEGEFVTILGPSGSGKSTLLHLTAFRRREIGQIYQFYNLIPVLNVEENICLPMLLDHRQAERKDLDELLDLLGLTERVNHLPSELSGGQQQRVAIGRALISKPKLILADEPTGNLDQKNSREIIKLFRELNEKYGQTILLITHDEKIAEHAERILVIEDGRIVKDSRR